MESRNSYDYIIAGTGCAGLSLAVHMARAGLLRGKKLLLADRDIKNKNDRTWCFWEKEAGPFEDIVAHQWTEVWFRQNSFSKKLDLTPYTYKLIRGIDFYTFCLQILQQEPGVEFRQGEIHSIQKEKNGASLVCGNEKLEAEYIFSSIYTRKPDPGHREIDLLQHFKGRVIETEQPVFDPQVATLMDFTVDQSEGTTFVYVMPFSSTKALVEYTLFTGKLLEPAEYDAALDAYINRIPGIGKWKITEEEFGIIPMTNHLFPVKDGNVIYIGTAGGQTKGSSGYTFRYIQKHSAALVQSLQKTGNPFAVRKNHPWRFRFYDRVLLDILNRRSLPGDEIFARLFQKNKPRRVLGFLDNETSLAGELRIISTLPTWPFLKAALRR